MTYIKLPNQVGLNENNWTNHLHKNVSTSSSNVWFSLKYHNFFKYLKLVFKLGNNWRTLPDRMWNGTKLDPTLRMDVMSLRILCEAGLKCALLSVCGKYMCNYKRAWLKPYQPCRDTLRHHVHSQSGRVDFNRTLKNLTMSVAYDSLLLNTFLIIQI